jgi:hypothetical protein
VAKSGTTMPKSDGRMTLAIVGALRCPYVGARRRNLGQQPFQFRNSHRAVGVVIGGKDRL